MDGRRIRKWLFAGCIAAGAVGCNRNEVRDPSAVSSSAMPVSGVPMPNAKKNIWEPSAAQTNVAVEVQPDAVRTGPPMPETLVAFANVQLEAAFDEKTPTASRQELLDAARQGYQKALKQDPKNKTAQLALARYYARTNESEKAVDVFKKYLNSHPNDREVAREVALAHAQWKDWEGAVSWCEYALKIDPENLTVRKTMAFCLARAGRWEEGLEMMRQVMPEAQARYLMARVLEHQNHASASRQQLQMALLADPNYTDAREFLTELDQAIAGTAPNPNPNGAIQQAGYTPQP